MFCSFGQKIFNQGGVAVKKRMTITEVADLVGISPKTLARWEKVGKIKKPKRDWRGWRVYDDADGEVVVEGAVFAVG